MPLASSGVFYLGVCICPGRSKDWFRQRREAEINDDQKQTAPYQEKPDEIG